MPAGSQWRNSTCTWLTKAEAMARAHGILRSTNRCSLPVSVRGRAGTKTIDRKSTRLNSSHQIISYAVFCLKKKKREKCKIRHAERALVPTHSVCAPQSGHAEDALQ